MFWETRCTPSLTKTPNVTDVGGSPERGFGAYKNAPVKGFMAIVPGAWVPATPRTL